MKRLFVFQLIFIMLTISFKIGFTNEPVKVGIQFGFNLTSFNKEKIDNMEFEQAINLSHGLILEILLSEKVSLLSNFIIIQKGAFVRPNTTNINKQKISLTYFEVPVLLKYKGFSFSRTLKPYLIAGPVFSFNNSNYYVFTKNGYEILYAQHEWLQDELGYIYGIGIEGKHFGIAFNFNNSISRLKISDNNRLENRTVSIVVNYIF